jgi:superfamily I DNA/RNA helicase
MTTLEFSKGSVQLNDEQFRVVTSPPSENQRILASAGSGKTTTITARIAYLVEEYGWDPSKILLVSFSRSAAQEMIHRVHRLIGDVNLYAGTFHALSSRILREQAPSRVVDQPFIDELPYRLVKWLETPRAKDWVKRFKTIIVDEFQDINDIQWQLINGFSHL